MKPSIVDLVSAVWYSGKDVNERIVALGPLMKVGMDEMPMGFDVFLEFCRIQDQIGAGQAMTNETFINLIEDSITTIITGNASDNIYYSLAWAVREYILANTLSNMETDLLQKVLKEFVKR
jgi:hypothetical protein